MPKIKCEQIECKYNNKNYCIKEGIYVREDAYCESFKKGILDRKYAFEIATFENDDRQIRCAASDCLHNKKLMCKASCICVSNFKTLCKDYKKKKEGIN